MSTHPCSGCARLIADAFLCSDCTGGLRDRLHGVRALVDELETALCRMARISADGAGLRVRSAETPLAFNWEAAESLWTLHRTLAHWAGVVAFSRGATMAVELPLVLTDPKDPARVFPRRGRSVEAAGWLARHIGWLASLPEAGELHDQINFALDDATRTIDRPAPRAYAGPCSEDTELADGTTGPCPFDLYAPPRAHTVTCQGCGAEHDMAARRGWLLEQADEVLVTAVEASRALPVLLQRQVTASMIRGYAHRGKIEAYPDEEGVGRGPNGRPPVFYRLGDIVACVAADEAERDARKSRHPSPRPSPRRTA